MTDKDGTIKVSVVIPVYDTGEWLARCLDSVLAQTLREIEVIVVDDCSDDDGPDIIRGYAERDSRIVPLWNDRNMGQGYSRNAGIAAARGEYIYLLDSDDMIKEDALQKLSEMCDENNLDGIFFDSEVLFESDGLERRNASYPAFRKGDYPDHPVSGRQLFELFMEQNEWTCYIQRQLWRRSFLQSEGIGFPVRHEHEDEVFAFDAILAAKRVMYTPGKYFIRRYREGSVMTSAPAPKNFYGYARCMMEMLSFLHERGISSKGTDRNLARIYEKLTRFYARMSGEYDLSELFSEDEMPIYLFFEASQKAYLYYGNLPGDLIEQARASSKVYIYGAGVIGKNVFEGIAGSGIAVEGFIVTDKKDAGKVLCGRPVKALAETEIPDDALIVIAVSEGYREEIEKELRDISANHRYYRK